MNIREILNLRLVCRMFCATIDSNEVSIVRHLINQQPLRRFAMLYQSLAVPMPYTWKQLLGLCHRFHVVDHLANFLVHLMVSELHYVDPIEALNRSGIEAVITDIVPKIRPYLLMLFHFLEMYRAELAKAAKRCDTLAENFVVAHRRVETHIVRQYNGHAIHSFVTLTHYLMKIMMKYLRPAPYAGFLERRLRGWLAEPAPFEHCMRLLVIGGLESVYMVISIPKYPERINALYKHLQCLSLKTMDHQLARRFYVMSQSDRYMESRFEPSDIMPPLEEEIVNNMFELLPKRDEFLNPQWLSTLFKPDDVVLPDYIQDWRDFTRALLSEEMDDDISLQGKAPASSPDTDAINKWEGENSVRQQQIQDLMSVGLLLP